MIESVINTDQEPIKISDKSLSDLGFWIKEQNIISTIYSYIDTQFFTCKVTIYKDKTSKVLGRDVVTKTRRTHLEIIQYGPNNGFSLSCPVGYIHQIQNHYFLLTKKPMLPK